ncbi:hypothetical protein CsatB_007051 [Cannabis sativa]
MEYLTYKYRVSVPELLTHSVHNSKIHLKRVERARKPDYPHQSVSFADQAYVGLMLKESMAGDTDGVSHL